MAFLRPLTSLLRLELIFFRARFLFRKQEFRGALGDAEGRLAWNGFVQKFSGIFTGPQNQRLKGSTVCGHLFHLVSFGKQNH